MVGSSAHGDHDALAQAAGELEGILPHPILRVGDAHLLQVGDGHLVGLLFAQSLVEAQALSELPADGQQGVEGGHGLLEDHTHLLAPEGIALLGGEGGELLAAQLDAAGDHPAVVGQQVHDGQGGDALATARFAHHAHGLILVDVKGDAPQHLIFLFPDPEGGDQILYLKHFSHRKICLLAVS